MDCSKCHKFPTDNWKKVRSEDEAFPDIADYPKHQSCLNCHRQQFFRGAKPPICSICHVDPGPRNSNRHPFPNPRESFDESPKGKTATSDFVVGFPHSIHVDIVSRANRPIRMINASFISGSKRAMGEESCSVCHHTMAPQGNSELEYLTPPPKSLGDGFWLKKGTFKSAPIGHKTCFTCHSADTGIAPQPDQCASCHKLKPEVPPADFDPALAMRIGIESKVMMDAWRLRDSAGKFQHEFFAHADLECATCHNVEAMNTADPTTTRVSITSCATCHVTATSDDGGSLNFEVDSRKADPSFRCVKCHIVFGKMAIPRSHMAAIASAAGK